jgi:hypothetical protein
MVQPLKGDTTFGSLEMYIDGNFFVVGFCVHGSASLSFIEGSGFVCEACDD